jgi:hypothetical protein
MDRVIIENTEWATLDLDEIRKRGVALLDNLDSLKQLDDHMWRYYKKDNVESVVVWCDAQDDEFSIKMKSGKYHSIMVEVVTKATAISNDQDYLNGTPEFKDSDIPYELEGYWSDYRKLGASEYYFRLM